MEPYKAKKMLLEYKIDKEMLMLISEANVKYGEYKSLLNTLEFDAGFFLDSVILNESYKSTQIEGTQISQDEMYYLKYMEITDDSREIQNLKKTIEYASSNYRWEIRSAMSLSMKCIGSYWIVSVDHSELQVK